MPAPLLSSTPCARRCGIDPSPAWLFRAGVRRSRYSKISRNPVSIGRRRHIFWVDERCVPPADSQSNFKLANELWLLPAEVPAANIHRIHGELIPDEAALKYMDEIKSFFHLKEGELPEFDLIHRGMGPDAHTASLFPGEPLIDNETGIAAAVWVEKLESHRVTLLPGVLKKSRTTVIQIAGADKAEPAHQVLHGPEDPKKYPCQIGTRNSNRAHWFLDKAAAEKL